MYLYGHIKNKKKKKMKIERAKELVVKQLRVWERIKKVVSEEWEEYSKERKKENIHRNVG